MPHEKIRETIAAGGFQELSAGHDRERPDVGAAQPGIMVMMMIVRTAPDTAGTKNEHAENPHEHFRHERMGKDGAMLLVMINDEQPQIKESRQDAARDFSGEVNVPHGAGHGRSQEQSGRNQVPP